MVASARVKIFISAAQADEDLLREMEAHFASLRREGLIDVWHRGHAIPGEEVEISAREHIDSAAIIVILLSAAYLDSNRENFEMTRAFDRHQTGDVRIVPVLARPCDMAAPISSLQLVPRGGGAVTMWADRQAAWAQVTGEIRETVSGLRGHSVSLHADPIHVTSNKPVASRVMLLGGIVLFMASSAFLWWAIRLERTIVSPSVGAVHLDLRLANPLDFRSETPPDEGDTGGHPELTDIHNIPIFRGTVVDLVGNPIHGAEVWLQGTRCKHTTDQFGAFTFKDCDDDRVPLLVKPKVNILVPERRQVCTDVVLVPPPGIADIKLPSRCTMPRPAANWRTPGRHEHKSRKPRLL